MTSKTYKYRKRGYCWACGRRTSHTDHNGQYFCCVCAMKSIDDTLNEREKEIISELKNSNLTLEEVRNILKSPRETPPSKIQPYTCKSTKIKFGVIGDAHIGNKNYDSNLMKYAAKTFNSMNDLEFVVFTGDICEGHYESKRQGSIFELDCIGGDNQVNKAVKELGQIKKPIYGITGNHETNTFYKMSGFDIGLQLQNKLPNWKYLGQGRGIINLPYDKKIELIHPDDGCSYAISYKSQKIVESLEGGTKPSVLLIGHYHKAEYIYYRNVHVIQTGCLESQTEFMREHGLSAHKGFWIIDMEIGKNGIKKFVPEFYPAY